MIPYEVLHLLKETDSSWIRRQNKEKELPQGWKAIPF